MKLKESGCGTRQFEVAINASRRGRPRPGMEGCSRLLAGISGTLLLLGTLSAQLPPIQEDQGVTGLGLALRKLPTTGAVLMITAHPDDENNALLARLSRGEGYRTGLLTLTRGDGGQNEIGAELFEALGVLRTEELLAVHRFDGAEQFFSRAYEFGFSYSVEETLEKWGKEEILKDIVRVIRSFRPHVILTLNPEGDGGGQHHQASARLAREAFNLAADPTRFPEQLEEGLRPWKTLRLFEAVAPGMPSSDPEESREPTSAQLRVSLGEYDSLLGETYFQFGARARSRHRSQGMNVLPNPGPAEAFYRLVQSNLKTAGPVTGFFEGLPHDLQSLTQYDPELGSSLILLDGYVNWAREAYSHSDYESTAQAVMTGLQVTRNLRKSSGSAEARFFLSRKEQDFLKAAAQSHFLQLEAFPADSSDGTVVPEQEFLVQVSFHNRSELAIELLSVELEAPPDWGIQVLESGKESWVFQVQVAPHPRYSQPFWKRADPSVDRFHIEEGFDLSQPFAPPVLKAKVSYRSFGIEAEAETPVQYRWFDAEAGRERRMEVKVVAPFSVRLAPSLGVVNLNRIRPLSFEATVANNRPGPAQASLRLHVPSGWKVEPASTSLGFQFENEERTVQFQVSPPPGTSPGVYSLKALAQSRGEVYQSGYQVISYSHIQPRHLVREAASTVEAFPLQLPTGLKVGYVRGASDKVGVFTEQMGAAVDYLDAQDLAFANLGKYDVIVTGVRAYLSRPDLIANNQRLLDYVYEGGHLVVQYNKYEFLRAQYAPYPLKINSPHDRVTVEDSPVKILDPKHPVFNWPNQIREEDWSGWVQERGLYFLGEWDERYQPLLELQDPWPYNNQPKRGALVFARFGKGTYVYTGLAFFRQLPAGVPGAFRLWANLLSLGRKSSTKAQAPNLK